MRPLLATAVVALLLALSLLVAREVLSLAAALAEMRTGYPPLDLLRARALSAILALLASFLLVIAAAAVTALLALLLS